MPLASQKDQAALTLKKEQDQWRLPGYFNVAVDSAKIVDFKGKLLGQKTGWPVDNTEDAAERLQVNQEKFERKLDGSEDYVLKATKQPYYFKVNKVQVDALQEVTLQKLVTEKPATTAKDTEANPAPVKTEENKP